MRSLSCTWRSHPVVSMEGMTLTIDCDDCWEKPSSVWKDCALTWSVGQDAGDALVIHAAEERAVRLLSRAGLVPRLRHEARAGCA